MGNYISEEKRKKIIQMKKDDRDLTLEYIAKKCDSNPSTVHAVLRKEGLITVRHHISNISKEFDEGMVYAKPRKIQIPKAVKMVIKGRTYYDYTDLFQKQYEDGYTVLMKRAVN